MLISTYKHGHNDNAHVLISSNFGLMMALIFKLKNHLLIILQGA